MEIIGLLFIIMVIGFFISTIYSITNEYVFVDINSYDEDDVFEEE